MPTIDKQVASEPKTKAGANGIASPAFTAEERAAMKAYVAEKKAAAGRGKRANRADGEADLLAALAAMNDADRALGERIHAIVQANAPDLSPKTWYGMPAYARDGKVVLFYKSAAKFNSRYATLGFEEAAHLDEGQMWPTSYALTALTPADEERIAALVRQAVS
jgi:uncharacterized protein YdhG (YjbR/CyaY superfamily)